VEFKVLGPLVVRNEAGEVKVAGSRRRGLLVRLLVVPNQLVSAARLAEDLWEGAPPPSWRAALQSHVYLLRRELGPDRIESRDGGYLINAADDEVDSRLFELESGQGRDALVAGQPDEAAELLRRALDRWNGSALVDVADAAWALSEASRLEELRLSTLELWFDARLALGDHSELVAATQAAVTEHQLRERLWGQLILALYRSGRQADALRAYQRLRTTLGEELGIEPSAELVALEQAVILQRPELDWIDNRPTSVRSPSPAERDHRIPVPARLMTTSELGFVGRAVELARIEDAYKSAVATEQVHVVLIAGEAGIGKTSLAAEMARKVAAGGATVLYGRCDDGLGVPYQPWTEALRHLLAHVPPDMVTEQAAARWGELVALVPELASRVDAGHEPRSLDPETARYMLFGAVSSVLQNVSVTTPVVIVLDDLQWADKPTLLLLRHLVAASGSERVLVIATFRPADVVLGHPLSELLALLHRERNTDRIELNGLDDSEVVHLIEAAAGHSLDAQEVGFAHALYRETDGNPFFTAEILRHLIETGTISQDANGRWEADIEFRDHVLPSSAREVIGQRVARLGEQTERVLRTAAVIGREFDLADLRSVTELDDEMLLDIIDSATKAALVNEIPDSPDRFTFTHALIEHTLYQDLSSSRRARLHRRVAEEIEDACHGEPGERVSELAHHWARALAPREPAKAVEYAMRAGERALSALAPDEAMRWYRQALELLEPGQDLRTHCTLMVCLGDAQRQAGDASYRETLLDAARRAQEQGASDLLIRAALANSRGFFSAVGGTDRERIATLEAALTAAGENPTPDRARLLALLAQELVPTGDLERRRSLSDEAMAIARNGDDDAVLLDTLNLRFNVALGVDTLSERRSISAQALQLAERIGNPVATFFAEVFGAFGALDAGDRESWDRAVSHSIDLADEIGQPALKWVATWEKAMRSWLDGDLDGCEGHVMDAFSIGFESGQPDATVVAGALLIFLRWPQGRTDEIAPTLAQFVADGVELPGFRAGLAIAHCEGGRFEEARFVLDQEVASEFASCKDDPYPLNTLVAWSHAVSDLDNVRAAELLLPSLLGHDDEIGGAGVVTAGAAATAIGQLQAVLGDMSAAEAAFSQGVVVCERLGSPWLLAQNRCAWARCLLQSGESSDRVRAVANIDAALDLARRYGLGSIERRAERLLASAETELPN
jgi:DNA-binding SARP family transcriptional activator